MIPKLGAFTPSLLPPSAGNGIRYPNGQVKLQTEANDHLDRLLAPDATVAWYRSIFANIGEFVHPEELAPIEVTSQPVALPAKWGLYRMNRKSGVMSVAIHAGLFGLLWSITTSLPTLQPAKQITTLVAPPEPFKPVEVKPQHGGGGGRTIAAVRTPAAEPPKPVMRHYTPPPVSNKALVTMPKLLIPPEWVGTSDPTANFGNPLDGLPGAAGGFGTGMGMGGRGNGSGNGAGNGSGNGAGSGPGSGSGNGNGAEAGNPIYTAGKRMTQPEPVFRPDAEYTEEARKAQLNGRVVLSVVVETDGTTSNIQITKALGMGLDQKAVEAVRQWKFKPATMAGKPVRARVNVEVVFRLLLSMVSGLSFSGV